MGGAPLVIPLIAFAIPLLLVLGALVFDVGFFAWVMYDVWHVRARARWRRLLHRSE